MDPKSSQETLKIGNAVIRRVDGARFLGLWVDEGLKWTQHIDRVKMKVSQLLGVVGRARHTLSSKAILALYNGLVLPHLQYCLVVWGDLEGGRNKTVGAKLLSCQKRFACMIGNRPGRTHSDPLFAEFGMLKIDDMYKQQLRMHAWQFWNGRLPEGQAAMLEKTADTHRYTTRAAGCGISLKTRDQSSIGYRAPKEWSALPGEIRKLKSSSSFNKRSKSNLIEQYKGFECRIVGCGSCWFGGVNELTSQSGHVEWSGAVAIHLES